MNLAAAISYTLRYAEHVLLQKVMKKYPRIMRKLAKIHLVILQRPLKQK